MMMTKLTINVNGYIEGFYGRLLKWSERHILLKKLSSCNFNTYFYCPKEDLKHRLKWREAYTNKWLLAFKNFCETAKTHKVNIIIGISPGLDFNFKENSPDFNTLVKKAKILKSKGATSIVLMFDDIEPYAINGNVSEGLLHAKLANYLSKKLNEEILVVPRVYCDELIVNGSSYLDDFNKNLNKDITIFYCGKKIISDTNKKRELNTIRKTSSNKIIFWDNLYANDYCPKKIFLGPYFGRSNFNNTMVNLTGLIKTDLFILDLIKLTFEHENIEAGWINVLQKYNIPKQFNIICNYFFPINSKQKNKIRLNSYQQETEALDFLLWKWKIPLSREWYQYMLILKQDLQLLNENLKDNRIEKIFPAPLKEALFKLKWRNK